MGKLSTLLSVAALAGVGYYVGKKVFEKKKAEEADRAEKIALGEMDESEIFVEEKHSSPKEKIQKASLFAVGAIKTGTEKFKEGIDEIINSDMISKGETTVGEVKEYAADKKEKAGAFVSEKKEQAVNFAADAKNSIKNEIDNLKSMVTSINTAPGEADEEDIIEAEAVADDADAEVPAEDIEVEVESEEIPFAEAIEEIKAEAAEAVEEIKDEFAEAVAEAEETIEAIEEFPADDAIVDDAPAGDSDSITDEASMSMENEKAEIVDELADAAAEMAEDIAAFSETVAEETAEAADDLDDMSFDDIETVDTFDFGSEDRL